MAKSKNTKKTNSRRKNNEGCVSQYKNGLWAGIINLGRDENGKRKKKVKYFHSEEEANKWVSQMTNRISSLSKESFVDNFENLMREWMVVFKQREVSPRTFLNNMRNFNIHIVPYIKGMTISEIDKVVVKKILNDVYDKTSYDVAKRVKTLLSHFFEYAVEQRLIEYNPAINTKIMKSNKIDVEKQKDSSSYKAIKPEDREKFLLALEENSFIKTICHIGLFAGLRIGEILGLRWKDIDFKNKTISIENAITVDVKFDEKGDVINKKTILSTPKTKNSIAVLPMVDILFQTLKDWYQERFDLGCKNGLDLVNPNTYIMANDDGSIRTYYGTRAIYRRFLNNHNFKNKEFHFHALRHTFATKLRENNENIYFIQDLMRHTTTRTTEKYMSKDKNNAINNAGKLNNVFNTNGYVSNKKDDFEM